MATFSIAISTGRVQAAQNNADNSQINERAEHNIELAVTGAHAAEETLNAVSLSVQFAGAVPQLFAAARREQSRASLRIPAFCYLHMPCP
jgi:hypothetical protein